METISADYREITCLTSSPSGGASGARIAFKMTPEGTESVLYLFKGGTSDGAEPGNLTQASDGSLYGMTFSGARATRYDIRVQLNSTPSRAGERRRHTINMLLINVVPIPAHDRVFEPLAL